MDQPVPPERGKPRALSTRRTRWLIVALALAVPCILVGDGLFRSVGPAVPPPAGAEPDRWVYLEGAANTRDAGGYPTRDGRHVKRRMIYRSATLAHLSSAGADTFRNLHIKTVIDLRNRLTPWPPFNGDVWRVYLASSVHGCPMSFAKTEPRSEFYIRGVRDNAASFRRAFELLADAGRFPVLYHCAAGADRTGVMTALLLSLLGVDRDTIIADFRQSESVGLPGHLDAMQALLDHVAARGSIEPFLDELGVSSATRQQIRANLLE